MSELFVIRDAVPDDLNFVMATFLRGLYYGDSWFSLIPKGIFMANYKLALQALLGNPNTLVKVACLPDEPNVIIGYSILSTDFHTIHWVYVKKVFRQKGIARKLLPAHPSTVTHLTLQGKELLSKFKDVIFNPFYTA